VPAVLQGLKDAGLEDVPVIVGGIIPDSDARKLREQGVARVFTPKNFGLTEIMGSVVDVVREANRLDEKVPASA
jgi:(2R)-ethylmalonyl-CoA mutase